MFVIGEGDKIYVQTKYDERESLKAVGAKWSPQRRQWVFEYNMVSILTLRTLGRVENKETLDELDEALFIDSEVYDGKKRDLLTKTSPKRYYHQWYAGLRLLNRKRLAAFVFMGAGKTRMVLDVIQTLFADRKITSALVIAPLSVVDVWRREADKWLMVPYDLYAVVGDKDVKQSAMDKAAAHRNDSRLRLVVTNYESVIERDVISDDPFGEEPPVRTKRDASAQRYDFFQRLRWGMVVADECVRISNRTAKVTKSMIRLADKAEYVTALTGTPIATNFTDLFSQLRFVDKRCFGGAYQRFIERFGVLGGWQGREVKGLKDAEAFWNAVRRFAVVIPADHTISIPEKQCDQRNIQMHADQLAAYRNVEKDYMVLLEKIGKGGESVEVLVKNALVKVGKLAQISAGFLLTGDGKAIRLQYNAKLRELEQIVREAGNEKIVVFTRFREELAIVREMLASKCPVDVIAGGVPDVARSEAITTFHQGSSPRVLVVQVQAGGFGIDLSCSRIGIFFSNPWDYATRSQCESRLARPPNQRACVFYDLVASDIDRKILAALAERKTLAEVLFKDMGVVKEIYADGSTPDGP
jgi:SNF2 family DNA or RNA helicase